MTGSSYYLWCLEHLSGLAGQVASHCGELGLGHQGCQVGARCRCTLPQCSEEDSGCSGSGGQCTSGLGECRGGGCASSCTLATILSTLAVIETGIGGLTEKVKNCNKKTQTLG